MYSKRYEANSQKKDTEGLLSTTVQMQSPIQKVPELLTAETGK